MLEIRPNCEGCNKPLPPDATDAYICSYECTFCHGCVTEILENVCPNCGGGLCPRPIRPKKAYRAGVSLEHQPESSEVVKTKYNVEQIKKFAGTIKHIEPQKR